MANEPEAGAERFALLDKNQLELRERMEALGEHGLMAGETGEDLTRMLLDYLNRPNADTGVLEALRKLLREMNILLLYGNSDEAPYPEKVEAIVSTLEGAALVMDPKREQEVKKPEVSIAVAQRLSQFVLGVRNRIGTVDPEGATRLDGVEITDI